MNTPATLLSYLAYFIFTYFPPLILVGWGLSILNQLPKNWTKPTTAPAWYVFVRTFLGLLSLLFMWAVASCKGDELHQLLLAVLGLFYVGGIFWSVGEYNLFDKKTKDPAIKLLRYLIALLALGSAVTTYVLITEVPLTLQEVRSGGIHRKLQELFAYFFLYVSPVAILYWAAWSFNKLPKLPKYFKKNRIAKNVLDTVRIFVGLFTLVYSFVLIFKAQSTFAEIVLSILYIHAAYFTMTNKDLFCCMNDNSVTLFNRRFLVVITVGLYVYSLFVS